MKIHDFTKLYLVKSFIARSALSMDGIGRSSVLCF